MVERKVEKWVMELLRRVGEARGRWERGVWKEGEG